jgi:hypothetical protein
LRAAIDRITGLYLDSRYQPEPQPGDFLALRRLVQAFRA